tara:strand:- start:186144 stop:186392 length:249 start_codon:yes stop_codon:yes gene_type:complete
MKPVFEWDNFKNSINNKKHGVSFTEAQYAFTDPNRVILIDDKHSDVEKRYFCIGKIDKGIVTVRFTYRDSKIRMIGAGFWRQ